MEGIFVPIALFAMIAVIVAASVWGGVANKRAANETVRRAIEAGAPMDVETISALQRPMRVWQQDLRGGIVMIALAIGFIVAGFLGQGGMFAGDHDLDHGVPFFIAAAIVGSIGVGQLIAGLVMRRSKDRA